LLYPNLKIIFLKKLLTITSWSKVDVPKKEFVFRRVSKKEPLSGLIDESKNEMQVEEE